MELRGYLYALLYGTLQYDDENTPNLFKKIKVLSLSVSHMLCTFESSCLTLSLQFGWFLVDIILVYNIIASK